ncbi:hypothetical protein N7470_008091 [Penicillium chermesinum]|nr:hypothetical protein N7470_008091 [Penicillium chermesinum]
MLASWIFGKGGPIASLSTVKKRFLMCAYKYALPFIVSVYDFWRFRRFQPPQEDSASRRFQKVHLQTAYSILRRTFHYVTKSSFRGIIAATLVSLGGYSTVSIYAGSRSTYICPAVTNGVAVFRGIAFLSMLCDSVILVGIAELFRAEPEKRKQEKRKYSFLSERMRRINHLQAVGLIWAVIGAFVQNSRSEHDNQLFLDAEFTRSAFGQTVLVVLSIISAWQMVGAHLYPMFYFPDD